MLVERKSFRLRFRYWTTTRVYPVARAEPRDNVEPQLGFLRGDAPVALPTGASLAEELVG